MKRTQRLVLVLTPLLTILSLIGYKSPLLEVKAEMTPWVKEAVPAAGESFDYVKTYDVTNMLSDQPEFPTEAGTNSEVLMGDMAFSSTNTYISMEGESRASYFTMGSSAFLFGSSNLGKISKITLDLNQGMYGGTIEPEELAESFGLQLVVGQSSEYLNIGPSGPSFDGNLVTWSFLPTDPEHPYLDPVSDQENISNFRLITLVPVYFDAVIIEGTRFLEITNGTTLIPAFKQNQDIPAYSNRLYDINYNNRTDLGTNALNEYFVVEGFSNATIGNETFTLRTDQPYDYDEFDNPLYMVIDNMDAIIIDPEDELLVITPTNEAYLTIKMDGAGWKSTAATITYGGQDATAVAESIFYSDDNFYGIGLNDGFNSRNYSLFNAMTFVPTYVTNNGVSIATPVEGVTGEAITGYLAGMIMDIAEESVDYEDVFPPEQPPYGKFVFDQIGDSMRLAENYRSSGAVQSMTFTITIVSTPLEAQPGDYIDLEFALTDEWNDTYEVTTKTAHLVYGGSEYTLSFDYLSGYYIKGFTVTCTDVYNFAPEIKIEVDGFEYYANVVSAEQQAMHYMWSFMNWTEYLEGTPGDGVCEFASSSNDWTMLSAEFNYMDLNSQAVLENNINTMKSIDVNEMFARYDYVQKSNPLFNDFMDPVTQLETIDSIRPIHLTQPWKTSVFLLSITLISGFGYYGLRRKKLLK